MTKPVDHRHDYEKIAAQFEGERQKDLRGCKALTAFRKAIGDLQSRHDKYYARPCVEWAPCFFTQHRSEIRSLMRRLDNTYKQDIERECTIEETIRTGSAMQQTSHPTGMKVASESVTFSTTIHLPEIRP